MPARLAITLLTVLVLAGCATPYSPQARKVQEAHEKDVRDCERIGEIQGSASGFHWSPGEAQQSARNQALERAQEQGATHMVWRHAEDSITPRVLGVAYRCSGQDQP